MTDRQQNKSHGPSPRVALLVATVAAAAIGIAFLLTGAWMSVAVLWSLRLITFALAAIMLVAGIAAGLQFLRIGRFNVTNPWERLVFAGGIGLGILSLLTLLLGLAGLLHRGLCWLIILALIAWSWRAMAMLAREAAAAVRAGCRGPRMRIVVWGVIGFFFLINLSGAFLPPRMYDVLEYHLAAAADYNHAGRVSFLEHNVYASFPENVEMLYLLGMRLDGTRDGGAAAGKVLNALFGVLAALAVAAVGRRLFRPPAGDIAALVFYVWPGMTFYSSVAFVTLPLLFYGVLAALGMVRLCDRAGDTSGRRDAVLAGVAAGLAMGCKYTAALFVIVPFAVAILLFFALQRRTPRGIALGLVFLVAAGISVSPWLVKNLAYTGNPVYPLVYSVFGGSHWSPEQNARWAPRHGPPGGPGEPGFFTATWDFLAGGREAELLLLLFVPFAFAAARRERWSALALLGYVLFSAAAWYLFTHRADRFLVSAVPFLALVSAGGAALAVERRPALTWTLLLLLVFAGPSRQRNYADFAGSFDVAIGITGEDAFLANPARSEIAQVYPAMVAINRELPQDARILFVGEARTFYCDRDAVVATVFNQQPLAALFRDATTTDEVFRRFRERGIGYVLINTYELARLQHTNRFTFEGRERLGMLDGFDWDFFGRFADRHLRRIALFAGRPLPEFRWANWNAIRHDYVEAEYHARREGTPLPQGMFVALYQVVP